jgi:hypothetical protein
MGQFTQLPIVTVAMPLSGAQGAAAIQKAHELPSVAEINTLRTEVDALIVGQTGGVIVFATYALLDAYTPTTADQELASYKVTNDANSSLNGYYAWTSGTAYTKDAELANGTVQAGDVDAVSGGAVSAAIDAVIDPINGKPISVYHDLNNLSNSNRTNSAFKFFQPINNSELTYLSKIRYQAYTEADTLKIGLATSSDLQTWDVYYEVQIPLVINSINEVLVDNVIVKPNSFLYIEGTGGGNISSIVYEASSEVVYRQLGSASPSTLAFTLLAELSLGLVGKFQPINDDFNKIKTNLITNQFFDGAIPVGVTWQIDADLQSTIDANIVQNGDYYLVAEVTNATVATLCAPNNGVSSTVFLDASFDLISTLNTPFVSENYTLPFGTKYIVAGTSHPDDPERNYILLNSNNEESITDTGFKEYDKGVVMSLPNEIPLVAGENLQLFKDSFVSGGAIESYSLRLTADFNDDLYEGEQLTQLLKTAGNTNAEQNLTFKLIDSDYRTITTDSVKVVHTTKKTSPASQLNVVLIGDSFTDQSYYPAELAWRLGAVNGNYRAGNSASGIQDVIDAPTVSSDSLSNINFIGTRLPTNAGIYHEGWSGKTYEFFLGKDTDGQNNSPMWDGAAFNIDHYMNDLIANNGATLNITTGDKIDVIGVILGTNKQSDSKDIREFIEGFISHNANIKILLAGRVSTAPFNNDYREISINTRYNRRVESIAAEYSQCYYVEILSQFDRMNNMAGIINTNANNRNSVKRRITNSLTEIVHPNANGYYQIADSFYSAFHHFAL